MKRIELFPGNYYHVVIRGAGGNAFLYDTEDWWLSIWLLFHLNDNSLPSNWRRELNLNKCKIFERPRKWLPYNPRVHISAFCIHHNHIHLLVKEIKEGGLTSFMRRYPNSLSNQHRLKYKKNGNVFQASYKLRIIRSDADLYNVALYIMSKNVFERYPNEGISGALKNFSKAVEWAKNDNFSSFADFATKRNSPLISSGLLQDFFNSPAKFIRDAENYLINREEKEKIIKELCLE